MGLCDYTQSNFCWTDLFVWLLCYNVIMQNLNDYIKFLKLTKPVMIRVSTRKHKAWDGYYVPHYSDRTGELKEHRITIYLQDNSRDFEATLAHELIHHDPLY